MFNAQRRQGRGQDKRERQAKPKIWEALGAKPIRHKLLQAKPKIWEALGAKPISHKPLNHDNKNNKAIELLDNTRPLASRRQ